MAKFRISIFLFMLCMIMLVSCAQVPTQQVWRPWIRTAQSGQAITPGVTIDIDVEGETRPLLGGEDLIAGELKGGLELLLKRRGYRVDEEEASYRLEVSYRTQRVEKQEASLTL